MTDSTIIEITNVEKSYTRGGEKILVLDQLSLSVLTGEFVVLMGPSGSGKTTLLNLIGGIDIPDAGSVRVGGVDLTTVLESQLAKWRLRTIGFVFQFYNLIPVLTALENVALPLSLLPMSKAERRDRAAFALELVGLSDRADHFPSQLSGGQEQRVAIARAVVTDPSIIIADEPTGDLDRHSAGEVLGLLGRLNQEFKKTIALVTHDPVAAGYGSRVVQLDKGKLLS